MQPCKICQNCFFVRAGNTKDCPSCETEKPQRIQRKRTKGWRMPPNTVYVGRGSKWGNPYKVGAIVATPYGSHVKVKDNEHAAQLFKAWAVSFETARQGIAPPMVAMLGKNRIDQLAGKNLACWCKENEPCHADVLMELANAEKTATEST